MRQLGSCSWFLTRRVGAAGTQFRGPGFVHINQTAPAEPAERGVPVGGAMKGVRAAFMKLGSVPGDGKLGSAAILLALILAAPAWAAPIVCGPVNPDPSLPVNQTCTVRREVSIFAGTLTVNGAPVAPLNLVWSSDQIASSLYISILGDPASDPRLTAASLSPFSFLVGSIPWALAEPDNLPSLLVAQGGILDTTYGTGTLTPSAPALLRGPTFYLLSQDVTFFPPGCFADCMIILSNYGANVTVYQQSATWTAPAPSAVPEPSSVAMFLLGGLALVSATFRGQRRARCRTSASLHSS